MMKGFKLLAIRPLSSCNKIFLKVLKPSMLYKFYQEFEFYNEQDELAERGNDSEIKRILAKEGIPQSFYSAGNLNINVHAIVGKNGSGKSSLIELLFAAIYTISLKTGILERNASYQPLQNLFVEIFYSIDDVIYCLRAESNVLLQFKILTYVKSGSENEYRYADTRLNEKRLLTSFFYTISVNYSIYGLNSLQTGGWIDALFHKNDGYQTPVVINPFREDGNIDVNLELYLAKQRLLSNIIINSAHRSARYRITDSQWIKSITFTLNRDKIEYAYTRKNGDKITFDELFKTDPKEQLTTAFYRIFCKGQQAKANVLFKDEVERYVIRKLIKIAMTYDRYTSYFWPDLSLSIGELGDTKTRTLNIQNHFQFIETYLEILEQDRSHLTFKLRQAKNYLVNGTLHDNQTNFVWNRIQTDYKDIIDTLTVNIDILSKKILDLQPNPDTLIEHIPPSLFNIEFNLVSADSYESKFEQLSSGEQQQIHTIQSVLYHLINVNSVFLGQKEEEPLFLSQKEEKSNERLTYSNVNIILDEIELYFHPEFQRAFLKELLSGLSRTPLTKITSINILFSTHSPFILSDISEKNVLGLESGECVAFLSNKKTFGANIHDLLRNEFFLSNGFMGHYARLKINGVINSLRKIILFRQVQNWEFVEGNKLNKLQYELLVEELNTLNGIKEISKEQTQKILALIGEPVLFDSLSELFNEAYPNNMNQINS